jgi:hypothetical protein
MFGQGFGLTACRPRDLFARPSSKDLDTLWVRKAPEFRATKTSLSSQDRDLAVRLLGEVEIQLVACLGTVGFLSGSLQQVATGSSLRGEFSG